MLAGLWTHADLVRDTFDIFDLLDAHDLLDQQAENRARANEAAQKQHPPTPQASR